MIKASDLKSLSVDELQEKLSHSKKALMQLRFQAKTGKLERRSSIVDTKKDVARIFTAINAQEGKQAKAEVAK